MAGGNFKDKDMQAVIGWVLRLGVIISMAVVFIGGVIYIFRHGQSVPNYTTFKGVPDFVYPSNIVEGILAHRGRAVIQLGIVLLIATPVLRIICSAIGFVLEKDRLYTFITLIVLGVIAFSMISGHAG